MSNGTNTNSSGEDDVAFDFTKAVAGNDKISDAAMAEIARRLQGFIGGGVSGAVVAGENPPQDKSKLWDPGDGQVYRYDTDTGQWKPTTAVPDVTSFPGLSDDEGQIIEERADGLFAESSGSLGRVIVSEQSTQGAGDEIIRVGINPPFANDNYIAIITPNHDILAGSRYWEHSRDVAEYNVKFVADGAYAAGDGTTFTITLIEKL